MGVCWFASGLQAGKSEPDWSGLESSGLPKLFRPCKLVRVFRVMFGFLGYSGYHICKVSGLFG